ncbi:hypothetical protein MMC25_005858 [Agyrium rufum]|nr:hypothetical protein [Agyrium rufum]
MGELQASSGSIIYRLALRKHATDAPEPSSIQAIIKTLRLQKHPEGGYYVETDRDARRVPSPFLHRDAEMQMGSLTKGGKAQDESSPRTTRSASTTIYYYLTPGTPIGHFHRNKGKTVHTLHKGRGRYVIIHGDEVQQTKENSEGYLSENGDGKTLNKARVESFVIGHDLGKGERLQWIVEGGKYKASYLLPDSEGEEGRGNEGDGESAEGLLISETVVPGFEFTDHNFMREEDLESLVTEEQYQELGWLLPRHG